MKTIEQAVSAATKRLHEVGLENPRMESEFLVAACLGMSRTHLLLKRQDVLDAQHTRILKLCIRQRARRLPLAYIIGEQAFRDMVLQVSPSVLIPRPETELVVEQALRILDQRKSPCTIVDVGTGSGNIALSLARHAHATRMIGIDVSRNALKVARLNEKNHVLPLIIQWMHGNLLAPLIRLTIKADFIVANLPYVNTKEIDSLQPELQWEPRRALDGGVDGLTLIRRCISEAETVLHEGGHLLLEIGSDQSARVRKILETSGHWNDIRVLHDFAAWPRMVQAVRMKG